jgi:hypothetical protein
METDSSSRHAEHIAVLVAFVGFGELMGVMDEQLNMGKNM